MVDQRLDVMTLEFSPEEYRVMQVLLLHADPDELPASAGQVLRDCIMPKFQVRVYADPRDCERCGG